MKTEKSDLVAIFSKGIVGGIPFVGPLAAEIIGATIPNQRIDRIESLLRLLEDKISEQDRPKIEERIKSPESVDLVEDAFIQGSRALSEERKEYIAALLKNGLTDDQLEHVEYKKLLSLLGELNDIEVLLLKSHSLSRRDEEYETFKETHKDALMPRPVHLQSTQEELDKNAIFQTHRLHLVNLGLLKMNFKKPRKGEVPELDEKTGMMKAQGYDITSLGRLLIRSIDQHQGE